MRSTCTRIRFGLAPEFSIYYGKRPGLQQNNIVRCCGAAYRERVMSIAEIRQLPLAEKLQIMEAIWEDLRARADQVPVPGWHKELLDERRKAVEEGREALLDWDAIKDSLGARAKK